MGVFDEGPVVVPGSRALGSLLGQQRGEPGAHPPTSSPSLPCQFMACTMVVEVAGRAQLAARQLVEAARHPGALVHIAGHQQHGLGQHGPLVILARCQPALGGAGHLATPITRLYWPSQNEPGTKS